MDEVLGRASSFLRNTGRQRVASAAAAASTNALLEAPRWSSFIHHMHASGGGSNVDEQAKKEYGEMLQGNVLDREVSPEMAAAAREGEATALAARTIDRQQAPLLAKADAALRPSASGAHSLAEQIARVQLKKDELSAERARLPKVGEFGAAEEEEEEEVVQPGGPPLTDEEDLRVDDAQRGNPRNVLITKVFQTMGEQELTCKDLQTLLPGQWLNDEVVNFTMALLQDRELERAREAGSSTPRTHFFNSFFYAKLYSTNRTYDYNSVRRWTTTKKLGGYSVLDCDRIVVPINQNNMHWVLSVINVKEQTVEHYDSMGGCDQMSIKNLKRYIADEATHKRQETLETSGWAQFVPHDIPHQQNAHDCGMFMCTFADYISREQSFEFGQEDMPHLRRRMACNLLDGAAKH